MNETSTIRMPPASDGPREIRSDSPDCALLSSRGRYTSFSFGDDTIRFMTSPRLVRYTAMHVHASDGKLTEEGAAKFFVRAAGSSRIMERGRLGDRELAGIQDFISVHYREMYLRWAEFSDQGFYRG